MNYLFSLLLISSFNLGTYGFHVAPLRRPAVAHVHGHKPTLLKGENHHAISHSEKESKLKMSSRWMPDDEKTLLVQEYQIATAGYAITVAFMLLQHSFLNVDILYSASGPFLGAVLAHILKGAAEKDRLGSDTYKRLNFIGLEYATCGFGIFCVLVVRAIRLHKFPMISYAFFGIANGLALVPFYTGLKRGITWGKSVVDDFWDGAKNVFYGLRSVQNLNASGYLIGTLFFGTIKISKMFEISSKMRMGGSAVAVCARVARFAKLAALTGIFYTLKDAADRNRLEGTTFIQLNFAASAVCASMAAYWFQGLMTPEVALASTFSVFTLLNGVASAQIKNYKAREGTS